MADLGARSGAGAPVVLESPPCGLCGGANFEAVLSGCFDSNYWIPGPPLGVSRCRACGLAQTRPRPDRESIGRYYPAEYGALEGLGSPGPGPGWATRLSALPYALRHGDPAELPPPRAPGARALDVGAGTGEGMGRLARLGWEPWGIEPDPALAASIGSAFGIPPDRVIAAAAEDAELPAASFDLIVLSHSLEHMHDPVAALRRARSWLAPGGELRVWVPNFESWERRLLGRLWVALDLPRHLFHFSERTLRAMVERAGFRVRGVRPQFRGQSLSGSVAHAARRLGGGRPRYRPSGALYWSLLPADRLITALGARANLELVAVPA